MLDAFVPPPCRRGEHFDHQLRSGGQVAIVEVALQALARNVKEVGLDDVELREHDVEGRREDLADRVLLQIAAHQPAQVHDDALVFRIR